MGLFARKLLFSLLLFTASLATANAYWQVLFSPDDKPTTHLVNKLDRAKKRIHVAVYMLTDKIIFDALIRAKKRHVDVQVIIDESCIDNAKEKIELLKRNHIDLFVYVAQKSGRSAHATSLMHHKFALIDELAWTGSFNWSRAANQRNQENVIMCDEKGVVEKYHHQFEELKKRCSKRSLSPQPGGKGTSPRPPQPSRIERLKQFFNRLRQG